MHFAYLDTVTVALAATFCSNEPVVQPFPALQVVWPRLTPVLWPQPSWRQSACPSGVRILRCTSSVGTLVYAQVTSCHDDVEQYTAGPRYQTYCLSKKTLHADA
eukprot:363063-Chlamydomonas_euryale.AAC.4